MKPRWKEILSVTFVYQKESLQPKVLRRRCDSVSEGLQNRTVYKSGHNRVIFNTVNPITNTNFNPKSNSKPKPNPTNTRRLLYSHSSYSSFRRAVPISHTASFDLMPTFNTAESPAASGICFHWNLCCLCCVRTFILYVHKRYFLWKHYDNIRVDKFYTYVSRTGVLNEGCLHPSGVGRD